MASKTRHPCIAGLYRALEILAAVKENNVKRDVYTPYNCGQRDAFTFLESKLRADILHHKSLKKIIVTEPTEQLALPENEQKTA